MVTLPVMPCPTVPYIMPLKGEYLTVDTLPLASVFTYES